MDAFIYLVGAILISLSAALGANEARKNEKFEMSILIVIGAVAGGFLMWVAGVSIGKGI